MNGGGGQDRRDVCRALRVSVIVPVHNNPVDLRACLSALLAERASGREIIVVDDASTDDTAEVAAREGVRVLRHAHNAGAGAARNRGAREARGEILFFVDADVVVAAGAIGHVEQTLAAHPEVAAVFGSYDARPRAPGIVSQYRNLLHHFVHQDGSPEAFTFWAGCGAIRRSVFDASGGFVERAYARVEDVELGYRLRAAGHRILLDKALQCTHLKRWTLCSMVRTDVVYRAVPWGRLVLRRGARADLNLKPAHQLSVGLLGLALGLLSLAWRWPWTLAVAAAALGAIAALNRKLYGFLRRERGWAFALSCFPLHLLYCLCSGVGGLYAWLTLPLTARDDEPVHVD